MSLEEQRRARFEKWILDNHCGDEDLVLRDNDGDYYSTGVAEYWEMYNAALDSIEIELPAEPVFDISAEESLEMDPDDYEAVEAQHGLLCGMLRKCRAAIEACGLKVKP